MKRLGISWWSTITIKKWSMVLLGIGCLLLPGAFSPDSWGQTTPVITSINPTFAYNEAEAGVTIAGANFIQEAGVSLLGNPTQIGSYNTSGFVRGVSVHGDYAYVAEYGLQIINISNPHSPALIGAYNQLNEAINGIYVLGQYAYLADGDSGLQIINISNPQHPILVGSYNTLGSAYGVYVLGNYAYVADVDSGLQIINISNPQNPTLVGSYDTPGYAYGVYVLGNYAYVADGSSGLQIINISDPQHPTPTGSYKTLGSTHGVYVRGNYAYVADVDSGLQIINIIDPQHPTLVGSCNTPGNAEGIYVLGDHAYMAYGGSGLQIINIIDPQHPTLVGSYDIPGITKGVYVLGDYAYVADYENELLIIQISYPLSDTTVLNSQRISAIIPSGMAEGIYDVVVTNPAGQKGTLTGGFEVKEYHASVIEKVNDKRVLEGKPVTIKVAVGQTATLIPLVTDKNPDETLTITYDGWMTTNERATDDNDLGTHSVLITVTDSHGLSDSVTVIIEVGIIPAVTAVAPLDVYNNEETAITISGANFINGAKVSLWGNPGLVSQSIGNIEIMDIVVSGHYAYMAADDDGLRIIDVSDKQKPVEIGFYDTPGQARQIFVLGNYAYVADDDEGLHIVNISNPQNPTLAGSFDTSESSLGVYVYGNYAYVADDDSGLQIINISNPQSPILAARYEMPNNACDVYVCGNYAYIADGFSGLLIINISDPQNPAPAGSYDTPGFARGLIVQGNYAYVADGGYSGLQIINITNPQNPTLTGKIDTSNNCRDVYVLEGYAYVANFEAGPQIINITNPQSPTLIGSYNAPDYARSVHVCGDYAYVADDDAGLLIINISDPQNPAPAGSCDDPDEASGVYVLGDYAYVTNDDDDDDDEGLKIIDISDPQNPVLADSYETSGDEVEDVYVYGDYAYVANGRDGLLIIRLSYSLTNSSVLDSLTITASIPSGVQEGIYNLVVTNPDGQKGMLPGGFEMKHHYPPTIVKVNGVRVDISGTGLYGDNDVVIPARAGGIFILTHEATDREENDQVSFTYSGWMTTNEKTIAYSEVGHHQVTITATDQWGFNSSVTATIEVAVRPLIDTIALDQNIEGSLMTISGHDFAVGAKVHLLSELKFKGAGLENSFIGSATFDGDYAYVQTYDQAPDDNPWSANFVKLHIIDLANKENPIEVGSYDTPNAGKGMHVIGNFVYMATGGTEVGEEISIIEVTDKTNPVKVGTYNFGGGSYVSLEGSGDYLLVHGTNYSYCGLESYCSSFYKIINISNRTNPVIVLSETCPYYPYIGTGECNILGFPLVSENYLYLMKSGNYQGRQIQIYDVTNSNHSVPPLYK